MFVSEISSDQKIEVLIVDRDRKLRRRIAAAVEDSFGWVASFAEDAIAAHRVLARKHPPKLIISGLSLQREAGASLIEAGSKANHLVFFLDKLLHGDDCAAAFLAGADDVLRQPFSMRELDARLRMRLTKIVDARDLPKMNAAEADLDTDIAVLAGDAEAEISQQAALTPSETEILKELVACEGDIVTRDQLSRRIDDCDWVYGDRKFDVHITKIRKKLKMVFGKRYIVKTIRSVGYAFYENRESAQNNLVLQM